MTTHKWQFASRFRRHTFGWRSDTPVQRIKEAIAEIKQVARKEPVLAAEGAITLLEKLSPALEQVDSSSGALGSAVNKAIETLVPLIAKAEIEPKQRHRWLERLWQALQDDEMPYIELLGDYWGELCVTPELASHWADEFMPEGVWPRILQGHQCLPGISVRSRPPSGTAGVDRQGPIQVVARPALGCEGTVGDGQKSGGDPLRRGIARPQ